MTDNGSVTEGAPGSSASPIADLTYRTYDGPLHTRALRWWIVALSGIRATIRLKGFWIVAALALLPYLILALQLYLQGLSQGAASGINPFAQTARGQKYASQFLQGLQWQMLFLFITGLVVGSGSIARDNQANALLVYLSKPLTKADYLLGKWIAMFLSIFAVAFVPAFVLYLYCLLSYTSEFLRDEPWLLLRIIGACAVPAAVHSSLLLGFSAWSKTGRMAGAFYAGFYYLGNVVTAIYWSVRYRGNLGQGVLERHLNVEGAISGLAQNILGVSQRMPTMMRHSGTLDVVTIDPPRLWAVLALALGLCVAGIVAARLRIRAVEVVRG